VTQLEISIIYKWFVHFSFDTRRPADSVLAVIADLKSIAGYVLCYLQFQASFHYPPYLYGHYILECTPERCEVTLLGGMLSLDSLPVYPFHICCLNTHHRCPILLQEPSSHGTPLSCIAAILSSFSWNS
jgi:hypothetical protein